MTTICSGSPHFDSIGLEIEVVDLQAERFADAQAGEGEKADGQTELVTRCVVWPRQMRWRVRDFGGEGFGSTGVRKRLARVDDLAMRIPSTGLARIAPERIAEPQIWESTLRCFEIEAAERPCSGCSATQTATAW